MRKKLNNRDREYIQKYYNDAAPADIAAQLGVPVDVVQDYIHLELSKKDDVVYSPELRSLPEWKYLQRQFLPDELDLFEQSYAKLMQQFDNEGILATEQKQIFQVIELEIFMHRNKCNRRRSAEDIQRLEDMIDAECSDKRPKEINSELVAALQSQLEAARSSGNHASREYNDLSEKHSRLLKDLKGVREQRIKQLADSKVNFLGLLKQLEEDDFRARQIRDMEIMKAALAQESARLSALHEYADGTVDRPLINSETVGQNAES
jgi:hypothetical protein